MVRLKAHYIQRKFVKSVTGCTRADVTIRRGIHRGAPSPPGRSGGRDLRPAVPSEARPAQRVGARRTDPSADGCSRKARGSCGMSRSRDLRRCRTPARRSGRRNHNRAMLDRLVTMTPARRNCPQPAEIRPHAGERLLRRPARRGSRTGFGPRSAASTPSASTRLGRSLDLPLGRDREIQLDPVVRRADRRQQPAARVEADGSLAATWPVSHSTCALASVACPQRSTSTAGVNQRRLNPSAVPIEERGLGEVHLAGDVLHPRRVARLGQHTDRRRIAAERRGGECIHAHDRDRHCVTISPSWSRWQQIGPASADQFVARHLASAPESNRTQQSRGLAVHVDGRLAGSIEFRSRWTFISSTAPTSCSGTTTRCRPAQDADGREVAAVRGVVASVLGMISGGATHVARRDRSRHRVVPQRSVAGLQDRRRHRAGPATRSFRSSKTRSPRARRRRLADGGVRGRRCAGGGGGGRRPAIRASSA